jgi:hypothetical protein
VDDIGEQLVRQLQLLAGCPGDVPCVHHEIGGRKRKRLGNRSPAVHGISDPRKVAMPNVLSSWARRHSKRIDGVITSSRPWAGTSPG